MMLHRITDLPGVGGRVTLWTAPGATEDPLAVYVGTETAGVGVVVGLEEDDVRQLVAALETALRSRAAGRRPDPDGPCLCEHPRSLHQDGEGPCRDYVTDCPCLVMRPASVLRTVQTCTTIPKVPAEQDLSLLDAIPEPTRSTIRRLL